MIPRGAHILANHHGTAPGIVLEDEGGRWVAMLPGVPREMRGVYQDALLHRCYPATCEAFQWRCPRHPIQDHSDHRSR